MVDLFGGTPSKVASLIALQNPGVEIVSGVNLPMLIQVAIEKDKPAHELVKIAIETGKKSILNVSEVVRKAVKPMESSRTVNVVK